MNYLSVKIIEIKSHQHRPCLTYYLCIKEQKKFSASLLYVCNANPNGGDSPETQSISRYFSAELNVKRINTRQRSTFTNVPSINKTLT